MTENQKRIIRKHLPKAIAVITVLVACFIWPKWRLISFPSLAVLALSYLAARVIIFPRHGSPGIRRVGPGTGSATLVAGGASGDDLETALRLGRSKLNSLQNLAFRISRPEARKKVDAISDLVARILDDIKQDPKDLSAARQFLDYYLEATVKVVDSYVNLAARPNPDPETKAACDRVEGELETIRAAFEKQLQILLENDVLDLDVELSVLKRTIQLEGLAPVAGTIPDTKEKS